jgi:hypothetical protein
MLRSEDIDIVISWITSSFKSKRTNLLVDLAFPLRASLGGVALVPMSGCKWMIASVTFRQDETINKKVKGARIASRRGSTIDIVDLND